MTTQRKPGKSPNGPRLALLVGNGTFRGGLSPLPGAIRDVTALHLLLSSGGMGYQTEHVKLAIEADLATLQQSIQQLCEDAERLDASSVLLYLSTHGLYHQKEYHLCVADSLLQTQSVAQTLPFATLREWLAPLRQRTQILLLDSCRTREQDDPFAHTLVSKDGSAMVRLPAAFQAFARPAGPTPQAEQVALPHTAQAARREDLYLTGENWAIVTSASAGEMAWLERAASTPFQDGPHSIFTRALLEVLGTTQGPLDIVGLHQQVSQIVEQQVTSYRQGITQTPALMMQCQMQPVIAERAIHPHAQGEPFQHLNSFSQHDHHRFFGRDGEIALAIGADNQSATTQGWLFSRHRHHILSAPSGAGKSSFLKAGLQPRLERQGHLVFGVDCRVPHALFKALFAYLGETQASDLPGLLTQCQQGRTGEVILLLDQFESLFLDIRLQTSLEVLAQQLDLLAQHPQPLRYRLLIALREDCVGQLLTPPTFAGDLPSQIVFDMSDSILTAPTSTGDQASKTSLDMSDSILAVDEPMPVAQSASETRLDMSDSILDATITPALQETSLDMSDSILAAPTETPLQQSSLDMSDSILAVEVEQVVAIEAPIAPSIQKTSLDMSDSILAVDEPMPVAQSTTTETRLDMSDSILDATREPAIDEPEAATNQAALTTQTIASQRPSLVDLLAIDNDQWHALPFLSFEQARQAIRQPLAGRPIQFSDALIFAMLGDLHQHSLQAIDLHTNQQVVYPPYLQIVCHTLYHEATRQGWREVQRSDYQQIGALDTLLSKHLQTTLQGERGQHRLDPAAQKTAWQVLKALVSQEGRRLTLAQEQLEQQLARREISQPQSRTALEALSERRLITCVWIQQRPHWSLTHDLLCRLVLQEIERDPKELALRQAHRSLEHLRDELRQARQQQHTLPWLELERAQPLAEACPEIELRIADPTAGMATSTAGWQEGEFAQITSFVHESIKAHKQEEALQQARRQEREALLQERELLLTHRSRLISWGLGILSLLLIVFAGMGLWARQQQQVASTAQQKALSAQKRAVHATDALTRALTTTKRLTQEAVTAQQKARARRDALRKQIKQIKGRWQHDQAQALFSMGQTFSKRPTQVHIAQRDQRFMTALGMFRKAYQLAVAQKNPGMQAEILLAMANTHRQISQERKSHLQQSLQQYQKALALTKRSQNPYIWARIQRGMGICHTQFLDDRTRHLRLAIGFLQEALQVFQRATHPRDWASTMNSMGNAWLHMPIRPALHYPQAIRAYRQALQVYHRAQWPLRWATTTHNLATAISSLYKNNNAQQRKAIALFKGTIEIKTFYKYPHLWGQSIRGIANAYAWMARQKASYSKQAMIYYKQALSVFSPQHQPVEWSLTLTEIARLYARHATFGKRTIRLQRAIRLYRQILALADHVLSPRNKADINYAMGIAYGRFRHKEAEALRHAISVYSQALQTYSKETTPLAWRYATENRIIARIRLRAYLQGPDKEQSRKTILAELHEVIQARLQWKQTRGLAGYRLAHAEFMQDPAFLLKELHAIRLATGKSASLALRIAEATLHTQQPQEAARWLRQSGTQKHPEVRLWQRHLAWQVSLYRPTASQVQRQQLCLQWLRLYRKLRIQAWKRLETGPTLRFLKRHPSPQATQIGHSMALFQGPFSCQKLQVQAQRCGLQWPQQGLCQTPTSQPTPRPNHKTHQKP